MRKILSNKFFILVLATLLIVALIIVNLIPGNPIRSLTAPISFVIDPVQKVVQGGGNNISDFFSAISEGMALKQENQELKSQVAKLEYEVSQGKEALLRWSELKEAFHIKDSFENYEPYGASILTREADEWFSIIKINIGTVDGLKIKDNNSYAVVDTKMNLVGRIMSTDKESSKILPVLHEGFSVSAKVNTVNGAVVRVHGEAVLKLDGLCIVDNIDNGVELKIGEELVTSGEGGLFPAGIKIGVIESIDDRTTLKRSATLRPYVNIAELKDVFVLVPKISEASSTTTPTPTPGA